MSSAGPQEYKTRTRSSRPQAPLVDNDEQPIQTPTKRKSIRKTPVKKNLFKDRKFFTVEQDWQILSSFNKNFGVITTREIADDLSEKLNHSSESVRDRIKRYISKLKKVDQTLLEQEAKVSHVEVIFNKLFVFLCFNTFENNLKQTD